jgi:signal transduction histidine kinase/DNA-binding response OmpR family regulator/ligand-binding sensor domain-containing protein
MSSKKKEGKKVRIMHKYLKKGRKNPNITIILWACLFIGLFLVTARSGYLYCTNSGLKYHRNYNPDDYMLQPQNWCVSQDQHGIIYVANHGGVLEYDGVSWNTILIPNQAVRSISIDDTGVIYVGGINELGFLDRDSYGRLEYKSLLEYIDENKKNFGNVWRTHITKEGIFFRTSEHLFRWVPQQKKMDVLLETKNGENYYLNGSFTCEGTYFINQRNVGLMQLENNSFKIIPGGEIFAPINTVFMIVPYDTSGKKILIGTREKGFFIYDGKRLRPFPTEVDDYLKENKACFGIALLRSPDDIAIATLRGGLVVTDRQGKLKYLYTKDFGLYDNNVKYVFEDSQGNLWAALNDGISKIEYLSPFSIYDDHSELPGMVYSVTRHSNEVYTGTSQGLFYLASNANKFSPVSGMSSACWSLLSIGDSLLAATSIGVFQVGTKKNSIRQISGTPSYVLLRSQKAPKRIWVGTHNTLTSLYQNPNQGKDEWTEEYKFEKVDQQIRTIVEDEEGNLWLGAKPSGVVKVDFPDERTIEDYIIIRYDTSYQLPGGEVEVCWAAAHVMLGTGQGLFRFDESNNVFIPDNTLGKEFSSVLRDVYRLVEDRNRSIWLHAKGRNYQAIPKPDRTYDIIEKPLARIPLGAQVNSIYPDPQEKVTWFATHKGLIRYAQEVEKDYSPEYSTIIRRVLVNGTPQFYNPYYMTFHTFTGGKDSNHSIPVFAYRDRNLRFEFAAPFFENETGIEYRYFLDGYENDWSGWHHVNYKDYTNIDAGVYTFRVQASNVYRNLAREAVFNFKIRPPWYRTWWAFLIYAMFFFLTIFLTVRWRSRKLELEKKKLEKVIKERTKEINRKNQQLEEQTYLLIEQAEKLKELDHAKSRFFANISHEFRTPLTLIIGPLEHILSSSLPDRMREKLKLMHRNSHRLQMLINRLLDLSRIDSGKMKMKAAPQDIIPFLKGILASFEQLIRKNKLDLEFFPSEESIILYFDAEKLEDVFVNLISNAVKFTPTKGKITVSVKRKPEKGEEFPEGFVEISIQDTGIGIPKEQLAHIFDRFYQVDSKKQKHKGSGIGLALTRELVTLHHGKIDVNSRVGENSGTQFIIRFPLGKSHLKHDEIDVPSGIDLITNTGEQEKFQELQDDEAVQTENGWEAEWGSEGEVTEKEAGDQGKEQVAEHHTVLVVEDNADMRQFIRESIEMHYTVEEAEDGAEGIRNARTLMPDLIISDIMMPEVDGYEFCQKLKKDIKTSHIPIILLTAKASEESKVQGLEIGADDYITKPFNTKILLTRIKNLIDLRRQLQEKFQRQMVLQPEEIKITSIDQRFIKKLLEIIETNIDDPDLNVEALSEKMEISRVTLNKKILALTGETATEFIRSYRLKRAMQLLKENFGTVLDVAMAVGFSSSAYFTKCFREKFHQLPSAFLQRDS